MVRRIGRHCALLLALSMAVSILAVPVPAQGERLVASQDDQLGLRPYRVRHGSDANRVRLTPIDPETLVDAGAGTEIALPEIHYYYGWWSLSGDGSTLATYDGHAIVVRDAATLTERRRFEAVGDLYSTALSHDGSRLVVTIVGDRQLSGTLARWQTYDVGTGALISTIGGEHLGALEYWIDAEARSLYQLWWETPIHRDSGPTHPTLIAYDLDGGRPRARLALPDVVAGGWWEDFPADGGTTAEMPVYYSPAGALLPDGKRFVVVHIDRDALTFVNTETMTVERTISLERPTSLADRLLAYLPLVPQAAAAAAAEGATLHAALHPDGRHLYVSGSSWGPAEDGYDSRGLGLRLIDLERGVIEAEVEGADFSTLEPSPDGLSLYAVSPTDLHRFDATTLETLAVRAIETGSTLDLMPAKVLQAVGAPPIAG